MNEQELRLKDLMDRLIDDDERISLWLDSEPAVSGKCRMLRDALNNDILKTSVVGISYLPPNELLIRAEENAYENP